MPTAQRVCNKSRTRPLLRSHILLAPSVPREGLAKLGAMEPQATNFSLALAFLRLALAYLRLVKDTFCPHSSLPAPACYEFCCLDVLCLLPSALITSTATVPINSFILPLNHP
ncbi:hypothetical protein K402DRAFT_143979 [Aulographum hederae CBS 113979]|uniref:Uncharacterized protein n=1 Tax=Aulographum hederae CBS 113979 TaxID=1176131 RepID=A0A6G1GU34_9PEZI|nr:hypothetical protein K402DRAFT_143979 [Aulographum hederae CBS 113979]